MRNFVSPRQNSSDYQVRAEADARLSEAPQFPQRFQDTSGRMGLRTNNDVVQRAPDLVKRLSDDSEKFDREAARLHTDSVRANLASAEFARFEQISATRGADMSSIGQGVANTGSADYPKANAKQAAAAIGRAGKNSESTITSRSKEELASAGKSDGVSTIAVSKERAAASSADAKAQKLAAVPESLRDALRRKLAASDLAAKRRAAGQNGDGAGPAGEGGTAEAAKASSFAQFFPDGGAEGVGNGGGRAPASVGKDGFFLSNQETDRVVANLMGSLKDRNSDSLQGNEIFGDESTSIFQRNTAFLRKCQTEKRVGER